LHGPKFLSLLYWYIDHQPCRIISKDVLDSLSWGLHGVSSPMLYENREYVSLYGIMASASGPGYEYEVEVIFNFFWYIVFQPCSKGCPVIFSYISPRRTKFKFEYIGVVYDWKTGGCRISPWNNSIELS
jgi:hypothetical protein